MSFQQVFEQGLVHCSPTNEHDRALPECLHLFIAEGQVPQLRKGIPCGIDLAFREGEIRVVDGADVEEERDQQPDEKQSAKGEQESFPNLLGVHVPILANLAPSSTQ